MHESADATLASQWAPWNLPPLPILHVSVSVAELDRAVAFYTGPLGCPPGRRRDRFADVWFLGCQITLYLDPASAGGGSAPAGHQQHFGATVEREVLDRLVDAVDRDGVGRVVTGPTTTGEGPWQQTKAMLADPDGNLIELKAYADPAAALADTHPRQAATR